MAEPMSIIGGISAVSNLADAGCSLAGSLYKAVRAIKDAPRAIRRLSKELEQLHHLLQNVDKLLQRYSTSLLVTEDGLSIGSVQSVLHECQAELESVQKTAATFERQPRKLKNAATRLRWVVDEGKIKQHCQTIEQLRQHINTGLSVLSNQYDIKARERSKSLHSQVTEVCNVLDISTMGIKNLVSSEVGTVRNDIEQVAVKAAISQEGLQTNMQTSHDHLYQEISHAGALTSQGIEKFQNDLRDTNLLVQRNQQHTIQEFLQMKQSIKNINSMVSQVLSLYSGREENLLDCSLVQHPRLEGIMFSLLMMRSSLVSAISELKSKSSLEISEEEIEFLLNEFEHLVAFSHDASALRIRQRCIKAEGGEQPPRGCTNHTSVPGNYALDVDSFSQPTVTRRVRLRTLSHANTSGKLTLSFENRADDGDGRPTSVLNATFAYVPNLDVHKTGLYATFRKRMRMGLNPSIKRSLRVIRVFDRDDDILNQLIDVFLADDLHDLQRMLSYGQIRPWDRDWHDFNLLTMALHWVDHLPNKIIDYLLVDAWDIDNSDNLQRLLWRSLGDIVSVNYDSWGSGDLDRVFQLSRRISALGHVIRADEINYIVQASTLDAVQILPLKALNYNELFIFHINQGADIECRGSFRMETALLIAAEADSITSSETMPALLQLMADYSAVDYKGRGPLHLALKPTRKFLVSSERLHRQALEKKLVLLLQAGCSIHAIDEYGRTPTDVARKWRRTKAWEAALQEVGKLECGRSECQCEIITEHFESSTERCWESNSASSEDSTVDSDNIDLGDPLVFDDEDNDRFSEIVGDSEQDVDMEEDEDKDGDTDGHEHKDQRTDTDKEESGDKNRELGMGEDEALDENLDLAKGKQSPRNEDTIDISTLSTPQVSKPDPTTIPEPCYDTIALGQHHIWI